MSNESDHTAHFPGCGCRNQSRLMGEFSDLCGSNLDGLYFVYDAMTRKVCDGPYGQRFQAVARCDERNAKSATDWNGLKRYSVVRNDKDNQY